MSRARSRSRSRARHSVAPGFQELAGLPGTLSTGRGGYLGQRDRRPGAGSRRASRAPHRPPAARGRRPAQVKRLLPAARALLPSSLWPPGPCLCVKGVPPPVQDLTPRIAWPPASLRVLGEDLRGLQRRCRSHSPGAVKLPPPSPPQPACSGDPGTKRPRQPMAAGQRRPAANH